ncbi:MAG: S-methyl-5'-thioadenosine phosphorylase [Candidatus Methylomirabilis oxygeniifera]|uniref:S-methyl-5'-thioadenosine phosphorylase n=1 Tax=Methylomirabilis oxygeniifera TaxID=671143 RepID=D5MEU5_METO1|nr:MAG: S-methyl-5'-thioadenosine phosphorylase [Candidatus Methylomirabilis oxyfera]CBE68274.1 5'-methylthioadenosine phosphorylase [Candidatus Methylomirabilis oxyfera]
MSQGLIGIIGGSGLYEMEGLERVEERRVETPFGAPSDAYIVGSLAGRRVAFLARHGRGHRLMPSELNFRANIFGFKLLGAERVISASAVGSMREDLPPLDIVIPDQFFDRTKGRVSTFFGRGLVAHVSFADPTCPVLGELLFAAGQSVGARMHLGGTYLCIEGPQFSTRAESRIYRSWGVDVIGMTNLQEAKLCREAEICYATLALVTDYDVWHETEQDVSVEAVVAILKQNAETAKAIIKATVASFPADREGCSCGSAMHDAIITARDIITADIPELLRPIIGKYVQ